MVNLNLVYTITQNFNVFNLEILLGNISFVILFLLMILYWVEAVFSIIPKFNLIIFFTTLCGNLALFSLLFIRWIYYKHFPLSNLYESLIFLSWSFTLIQLILIPFILNLTKTQKKFLVKKPQYKKKIININILIGTIISPIALFINSFATFSLPKTMQKAQALVPALQSNWLMMHVTVMMLSYTALLCGSLLAMTFLIVTWYQSNFKLKPVLINPSKNLNEFEKSIYKNDNLQNRIQSSSNPIFLNSNQESSINELTQTLDNLSYRILGIGFPLLTIGILSGAVWANEAWGSYWSWDPKETWAFITWLVFAIYLHTRITKGWKGQKPAILASFGFFIVWICYLGVNILGTGLHSYGWVT